MSIMMCEKDHRPCTFDDYYGCPTCKAILEGKTLIAKLNGRISFLENEIDHLYIVVFNKKRKEST